ncbi:MAG: prepilin-type N-terminal cleavage/methylation domain-containing protein [Planctomycetales bacterium]|nr:prepilin-type N-terminal cleavage/methylation domain-containing protein [Planctomycetales bacterium]
MRIRTPRKCRSAFTLLEVILAVALTAIVMGLIAGAIDFHLRQLTIRRTHIEEAQLARSILRRIADDLRAVVVHRTVDFSSVEEMTEIADAADDALDALSGEATTETTEPETTAAEDLVASSVSSSPGIFGNQFELQVDISRIPRYEEYEVAMQTGLQIGGLSDMKTVTYYLGGAGTSLATSTENAIGMAEGATGGLVRRVVSRATSRYAMMGGTFDGMSNSDQLMAPEVSQMQFQYFDGYQWNTEWDSDVRGGIPVAVEVMITINNFRFDDPNDRDAQRTGVQNGVAQNNVYRLVVYLPGSEPLDPSVDPNAADSTSSDTGAAL